MRYLISDTVFFEGRRYRFSYDTKYKRFDTIQSRDEQQRWDDVKLAPENFYVFFPGFTKTREAQRTPNHWSRRPYSKR